MAFHLDEKTKIPLYAVAIATPTIFGFVFWLSTMYVKIDTQTEVNAAQDVKLEAQGVKLDQLKDLIIDVRERTIRIETKLDNK